MCTNKREYLSRKLLEALGLQYYFHSVAGPQHVRRVEAGPGHVTHVIAFAGGEPSHTIMVGGNDVDIGTAKRAHVPSILVSFGYAPEALHELATGRDLRPFDQLVPKATSLLGASPAERQHR